ncbi:MAG: chitobiase/beta-hexosaminidase C-terminal domain-containing protein, partial [Verrucomicrobiota bacterium]
MKPPLLLLLGFGLCLHSGSAAPLLNEFMAVNQSTLADADGDFPDWIEIANDAGTSYDLSGHFLTDDAAQPTRWAFPAVTLPPNGFLMVFASGKNRPGPSELHTNFSLKSGGEYLAIVAPDGATILDDFATYPPQTSDVSYGRLSVSTNSSLSFFNQPTPGATNDAANAPAESVRFSQSSRTFTGSLSVALSVDSPTARIRFTTNGAAPTSTSPLYTGPITVTSTTAIRAIATEPGRPNGPLSAAYFVHLNSSVTSVSSDLPLVIIETFGAGRPTSDRTAVWMIFEPNQATGRSTLTQAPSLVTRSAVRVRGSSTAGAPKYSMNVEARDENDEDKNITPLGLPSESDWILSGRYTFDRTLIHNPFIYEISNQIGRYAV